MGSEMCIRDSYHSFLIVQDEFVVDVRGTQEFVAYEDAGYMRVSLKAISLNQAEYSLQFGRIVHILGEHVLHQRVASRPVHEGQLFLMALPRKLAQEIPTSVVFGRVAGRFEDVAQFNAGDIQRLSPVVRERINAEHSFVHPDDSTINRVSHVQWTGRATQPEAHARNAVFYGDKGIDRSPCGTGTSARMAQLVARDKLAIGERFVHESIIGSLFTGCAMERTRVGDYDGIIPTIEGWARITGFNTIVIDERDPYAHGFLLP